MPVIIPLINAKVYNHKVKAYKHELVCVVVSVNNYTLELAHDMPPDAANEYSFPPYCHADPCKDPPGAEEPYTHDTHMLPIGEVLTKHSTEVVTEEIPKGS